MWMWYGILINVIFLLPGGYGLTYIESSDSQGQRACTNETKGCNKIKERSKHQPKIAFVPPILPIPAAHGWWCGPGGKCYQYPQPFYPYPTQFGSGNGNWNGNGNGGGNGGGNGDGNVGRDDQPPTFIVGNTKDTRLIPSVTARPQPKQENATCTPFQQHILLPSGKLEKQQLMNCLFPNKTSVIVPMPQIENNPLIANSTDSSNSENTSGSKEGFKGNGNQGIWINQNVEVNT